MPITVSVPKITSAAIAPNPATINGKAVASITITEEQQTLYERYQYCGAAHCGGGI